MNSHGLRWLLILFLVLLPARLEVRAAPCFSDEPPAQKKSGKRKPKKRGSKEASGKKGSKKKGGKKVDMSDLPPDEGAEAEALDRLGEDFRLRRTRHYSILYNTSQEDVRAFGVAIEQTYRSCVNYCLKLGVEVEPPKKKLLIYYFEEHGDYSRFSRELGRGDRPQSQPGVFFPDLNRSMFFNFRNQESFKRARKAAEEQIEELKERLRRGRLSSQQRKAIGRQIAEARKKANRSKTLGGDMNEAVVQHEVSHQVLWNVGFHNPRSFLANPRWFIEGTAMMFEPISDGRSANFGAVNTQRLRQYRGLLQAGKLIPVRDFISSMVYFDPKTITIAYAESWSLVHYLNRTKRQQVKKYVARINKRPRDYRPTPEDEITAFEEAFGKIDRRWVARWQRWMKKVQ